MRILLAICLLLIPSLCLAQYTWKIERDGDEITMKKPYDFDPAHRYRGEIDEDGNVQMRNGEGRVLRGNIDQDGYGKLYDEHGNVHRVKPN